MQTSMNWQKTAWRSAMQKVAALILVLKMTIECNSVLIAEEGQPFIEDIVRGVMPACAVIKGKLTGELPRTGELTPDLMKKALGLPSSNTYEPCADVVSRPPALCKGCGHRDVYAALNEVLKDYPNARVFGDIGCYTLGFLPPYKAIHSCVDMGASIGMAKGAADAGHWPAIAIIGEVKIVLVPISLRLSVEDSE